MSQEVNSKDMPCKEKHVQFSLMPVEFNQNYYDRRASMFTPTSETNKYQFSSPLNIARRSPKSKVKKQPDKHAVEKQSDFATSGQGSLQNGHKHDHQSEQRRRRKKKSRESDGINAEVYRMMLHDTQRRVLQEWMDGKTRHHIADDMTILEDVFEEGSILCMF